MNQDWNIKARGESCTHCGRTFTDQEAFMSRLFFGDQGYVRNDYCEGCWPEFSNAPALSTWKTIFKLPPPPKDEPLKKENAESLLRKLMETEEATNRNVIYILAVMLERRRVFVERDVQIREDGVKIRVYEHKTTGESFMIPDPELRLRELTSVQAEVLAMLGGEKLEHSEPTQPPPQADETQEKPADV